MSKRKRPRVEFLQDLRPLKKRLTWKEALKRVFEEFPVNSELDLKDIKLDLKSVYDRELLDTAVYHKDFDDYSDNFIRRNTYKSTSRNRFSLINNSSYKKMNDNPRKSNHVLKKKSLGSKDKTASMELVTISQAIFRVMKRVKIGRGIVSFQINRRLSNMNGREFIIKQSIYSSSAAVVSSALSKIIKEKTNFQEEEGGKIFRITRSEISPNALNTFKEKYPGRCKNPRHYPKYIYYLERIVQEDDEPAETSEIMKMRKREKTLSPPPRGGGGVVNEKESILYCRSQDPESYPITTTTTTTETTTSFPSFPPVKKIEQNLFFGETFS